jgi:hypothetical protein
MFDERYDAETIVGKVAVDAEIMRRSVDPPTPEEALLPICRLSGEGGVSKGAIRRT